MVRRKCTYGGRREVEGEGEDEDEEGPSLFPPLLEGASFWDFEKKESRISNPKEQQSLSKTSKTLKMTYNLMTDCPRIE
jgi:hypothetical protein